MKTEKEIKQEAERLEFAQYEDSCGNCRFHRLSGDEGECRRHAPFASYLADRALATMRCDHLNGEESSRVNWSSYWPTTDVEDWCGEYEPTQERLDYLQKNEQP